MNLATLALLAHAALAPGDTATAAVFSGRERQLSVRIPRIEASIQVDGDLNEPVWAQAAVLNGFSQYAPNDGLPAADSTQVLVWYSPNAIHFAIRAFESHGAPTATLADRDRIFGDDNVQILLGTFHDARQALMFAVNPLGVQGDGALVEGANTSASGFIGSAVVGREQADLSPDYVFQSKGRVTPWGYQVEVRIPFKSLRYQPAREQSWKLNVVRQVKHSGFEDSWVPALRASPSFLGQSGEIVGLTGLHRGLVMDLNPEATLKATGAPEPGGAFARDAGRPQVGGTARWGITNSLSLSGTVHPDFSQVESDAGQLAFDPRNALYFPEKRPFFLEGSELFQLPNNLIYTRQIQQPVAAVKLTGNVGGTSIGLLSAVDDRFASATGEDHPVFNIIRLQRGLGSQSRLGVAYLDQVDGSTSNRVAEVDGRWVFGGIYNLNFQLAGSRTDDGSSVATAPLWLTQFNVRDRHFGLRTLFAGIGDRFVDRSGFIGRSGIVHAYVDPSWTVYGRRGALLERFTADVLVDGIWQYRKFVDGGGMQDRKLHLNGNAALRGGWNLGLGVFVESFGYDAELYSTYRLEVPGPGGVGLDTIPFVGQPTIPNLEYIVQFTTPQWRHFSANGFFLQGRDENFFEWASGDLLLANLGATFRPTERIRAELTYNWQQVNRRTDGSRVNVGRIPRLKLEYQVSRPFFVRLVGQYVQQQTDSLRDDSRTNAPILIATADGVVRSQASRTNLFHGDVLLSYQPIPGTVILAGYGSDLNDERAFGFRDLTRTRDAFFAKVSWLFRM
ncbi:MAG: DUF5916 domain-containing protein [Longimicrobiaceae bacterium]